jgi:pimeloyl-ACP methyl ester carboxylesterase
MATDGMSPVRRPEVTSGYVPVNGLDMYYELRGEGAPLVLLHGAMGTIESCFARLLPGLAATRKVIAAEFQGHGHTADIDRPLSIRQLAEDTAVLLRALEVERADLVGYSMGGGVALQLAMDRPGCVRRLVFAGGACYRPDGFYPELFEAAGSPADLDGSLWHRAYAKVAPHPEAWPGLVAKVAEQDRAFTGWPAEQIRGVAAPTLLIIGDSDVVRPEHTVEMFRLLGGGVAGDLAGLPDSQLAILPGTSHEGILQRADWLRSMILAFLDGTPTPVAGQGCPVVS